MKAIISQPYALLTIGCLLAACGQLFLKSGTSAATQWQDFINLQLLAGLVFYAAGTILWILALVRIDLHIAYAFTALTFFLVYLGSIWILGEHISTQAFIGLVLISVGFLLIAAPGLAAK